MNRFIPKKRKSIAIVIACVLALLLVGAYVYANTINQPNDMVTKRAAPKEGAALHATSPKIPAFVRKTCSTMADPIVESTFGKGFVKTEVPGGPNTFVGLVTCVYKKDTKEVRVIVHEFGSATVAKTAQQNLASSATVVAVKGVYVTSTAVFSDGVYNKTDSKRISGAILAEL